MLGTVVALASEIGIAFRTCSRHGKPRTERLVQEPVPVQKSSDNVGLCTSHRWLGPPPRAIRRKRWRRWGGATGGPAALLHY
jgi:hypothetical protein